LPPDLAELAGHPTRFHRDFLLLDAPHGGLTKEQQPSELGDVPHLLEVLGASVGAVAVRRLVAILGRHWVVGTVKFVPTVSMISIITAGGD
jgi:hypothetical protein